MLLYLKVFIVGGLLCVLGEILILKTKLTPARILVLYVTAGVVLSALGLYTPLVRFAAAGATVPLTGFGHLLAQGAPPYRKRACWGRLPAASPPPPGALPPPFSSAFWRQYALNPSPKIIDRSRTIQSAP